jgi:uncharacterized protein (TIGR03437 family)
LTAGGVVNAASFAKNQAVAPGSLVSVFGANLTSTTAQAGSIPLSTSMANVSVTFNGVPAPLLFVSHSAVNGDQINAQLPWEIPSSSTVQAVVSNAGTASAPVSFPVTSTAPGIFAVDFGVGTAIAYSNSDYQLAAPAGSIPGLNTHPAKIGDTNALVILATGLGPVTPAVYTGNNVTDGQFHTTVTMPTVLVGQVPAKVLFSGMSPSFVGVYQLNVVIQPGTPTGDNVPLQLQMNGVLTTDQVTIAVSQ